MIAWIHIAWLIAPAVSLLYILFAAIVARHHGIPTFFLLIIIGSIVWVLGYITLSYIDQAWLPCGAILNFGRCLW